MLWFQLSDCYRGVVFDSLETLFARNAATALLCLLKAIGNREHIYVINMAQDYAAMKAQEKAKNEQEGKAIPSWAVLLSPINLSFKQSSRLFTFLPCCEHPLGLCCYICHLIGAPPLPWRVAGSSYFHFACEAIETEGTC